MWWSFCAFILSKIHANWVTNEMHANPAVTAQGGVKENCNMSVDFHFSYWEPSGLQFPCISLLS